MIHEFPRPFVLVRDEDPTGISGTGKIVEGVVYSDGTVSYHWMGDRSSWSHMKSIEDMQAVHGHDGKTRVVYPRVRIPLVRRWVCMVLRTGAHNGHCHPLEPHGANWDCGYRWEISLTDAQYEGLYTEEVV